MRKLSLLKKGLLIGVCAASVICCGAVLGSEDYATYKIEALRNVLDLKYLYELRDKNLEEKIYSGYVQGVDNYGTCYYDKDEFKVIPIIEAGDFYGTGLDYIWAIDTNSLIVVTVLPNSPAAKAGVKIGDHITKIGSTKVIASNQYALGEMMNDVGTKQISFEIEDASGKSRVVTLEQEKILVQDVDYRLMDGVGYIKLNSIKEGTSERIKSAALELMEKKAEGLVLDLRDLYSNNIEEVAQIADLFLDGGIAFVLKNKGMESTSFPMKEEHIAAPLAVIINEDTTCSAEALAMALQTRGTLVGETTYGTPYHLTYFDLGDETGISIATEQIYDGMGKQYEKVKPKVVVSQNIKTLIEYYTTGAISDQKDALLQKAIGAIK